MKIINIFITHDLTIPLHVQIFESSELVETREILAKDISNLGLELDQIEVLLSAECASIIQVNLPEQLSNRKITESYLLSLLEDQLLDDIDNLVPIMMRVDDIAYVAVLDKEFHSNILKLFNQFDKPIKYIQLQPLLTDYSQDALTVYCSDNINFIRNSTYEYYIFDNNNFDLMFNSLITSEKKRVILYGENTDIIQKLQASEMLVDTSNNINYRGVVWNLRFNKSSRLSSNFWKNTYNTISELKIQLALFLIIILTYLVINISANLTSNITYQNSINKNMKYLGITEYNAYNVINKSNQQLEKISHDKGLNDVNDFVSLFQDFLQVANVQSNTINSIEYKNKVLRIFLNGSFRSADFSTYQASLKTFGIDATVMSFNEYNTQNTKKNKGILDSSNNNDFTYRSGSEWVVTMNY